MTIQASIPCTMLSSCEGMLRQLRLAYRAFLCGLSHQLLLALCIFLHACLLRLVALFGKVLSCSMRLLGSRLRVGFQFGYQICFYLCGLPSRGKYHSETATQAYAQDASSRTQTFQGNRLHRRFQSLHFAILSSGAFCKVFPLNSYSKRVGIPESVLQTVVFVDCISAGHQPHRLQRLLRHQANAHSAYTKQVFVQKCFSRKVILRYVQLIGRSLILFLRPIGAFLLCGRTYQLWSHSVSSHGMFGRSYGVL